MGESRKYRKSSLPSRSLRSSWPAFGASGRSARSAASTRSLRPSYYGWRDQLLAAGAQRFAGKDERVGEGELRKKVAELERALGRKTYELEVAGKLLRDWE